MNKIKNITIIILVSIFEIVAIFCTFIIIQRMPIYKCIEYKESQITKRKTFYPIVPGYETYTQKECVKKIRVR